MKKRLYSTTKSMLVPAVLISVAALFSTNVYATGGTGIDGTVHIMNLGGSASFTDIGGASSYADNPLLNSSSWAHTGKWYTFMNHNAADFTVTVNGGAGFAPGISVWASGGTEFDGGTAGGPLGQQSTAGFGTPHSFNSNGAMGDFGTVWMADGQGGNMKETLGYAMSGVTHLNSNSPTGWGEDLIHGAHDVSLTDTYESGVTGSTSANSASLSFNNLAEGWYTVYVGGTDHSLGGGSYELSIVSAVPEAETWAMLLAGLGLIGWRLRKQQTGSNMVAA